MQRELRVPMSLLRGTKLPPSAGIWGTDGSGSWPHFQSQIPDRKKGAAGRDAQRSQSPDPHITETCPLWD